MLALGILVVEKVSALREPQRQRMNKDGKREGGREEGVEKEGRRE